MTVGWFSWTNRNCLLLVATKKIALFSIDNILRLIMAISCLPKWANAAFRVIVKDFEIKELFFFCNLFLHYTKQIDSMLPCVWSVIGHSRRKNVVRTSMKHSTIVRVPLFCSYHILTSSVIYYWTDGRQHGIYLLNNSPKWGWIVVDICRAAKRRGKYPPLSPTVVHLERWTDFFQTFPVGSNRSIQF